MEKRAQNISKGKISDTYYSILKLCSYLFKLLYFNRKTICVVMQSGNAV